LNYTRVSGSLILAQLALSIQQGNFSLGKQ